MPASAPSTTVKSAMRTLDIIEYVVAHGQGAVAQDIAAALAIPVSSLSYLLSTLVERDYLVRNGRRYLPGPGLERLAAPTVELSVEARVRTLLRSLRGEINETCSFMVLEGWEIEARVTESSDQALRYAIDVGSRKPLHGLAAGKAVLAALPEPMLERYFREAQRVRFTDATLVGEAQLRGEIARIRDQGFAVAREEDQMGVVGVACSLKYDREAFGAVAVALPTVRCDEDRVRDIASRLMRIADQLCA